MSTGESPPSTGTKDRPPASPNDVITEKLRTHQKRNGRRESAPQAIRLDTSRDPIQAVPSLATTRRPTGANAGDLQIHGASAIKNRRRPNAESAGDDANFGSKPIAPIHNQRLPTRSIRSRTRRVDQPIDAKNASGFDRNPERLDARNRPPTSSVRSKLNGTSAPRDDEKRSKTIATRALPDGPARSGPIQSSTPQRPIKTDRPDPSRREPSRKIRPSRPPTQRGASTTKPPDKPVTRSARSTPVEPNHQNPTVRASIPLRTSTPKQPHAPDQRDPFQSDPIIKIPTARGKNDPQPDTPARAGSHRTGTPASLRIRP